MSDALPNGMSHLTLDLLWAQWPEAMVAWDRDREQGLHAFEPVVFTLRRFLLPPMALWAHEKPCSVRALHGRGGCRCVMWSIDRWVPAIAMIDVGGRGRLPDDPGGFKAASLARLKGRR